METRAVSQFQAAHSNSLGVELDMSSDLSDTKPGLSINPDDNLFPDVRIVLVETTHPGNIGAAARAMKNMGVTRLVLVNPRLFPHEKAVWRSASAEDVVASATVVATVDEAVEGCHLVVGTSARNRRIPWPMLNPRACGQKVFLEQSAGKQVAIVFGREAHGLKNEELQKCHFHVNIPTGKAYSSLNLAMAVQVLTYEILQASLERADQSSQAIVIEDTHPGVRQNPNPEEIQPWDMDYATAGEIELFFAHLEETLIQLSFHDPDNPRQMLPRLRRMFNRIRMDKMELNIMRGFLTAVNKMIKSF